MNLTTWNELTKPRVTFLVLATVMPGLYLGTNGKLPLGLILSTLLGTYFFSSSAFILNQYLEREKDAIMYRTKERPIPSGKVSARIALVLGFLTGGIGFGILYFFSHWLAALCAFGAWISYLGLYTLYLKPRTDQNIVWGGISGCFGPLIGYAASSGSLPIPAWILFLMIFFWTPAHFWALAIFLKNDYERANIPMLPVSQGISKTTKYILFYSILYSLTCYIFYYVHEGMGWLYLLSISMLTILLIGLAIRLIKKPDPVFAKKFFFFSILHLFIVTVVIIVDARLIL